jgi:hypothetical protein
VTRPAPLHWKHTFTIGALLVPNEMLTDRGTSETTIQQRI